MTSLDNRPILKAVVIFTVSWVIFLSLWPKVETDYCLAISRGSTLLATKLTDVDQVRTWINAGVLSVELRPQRTDTRNLVFTTPLSSFSSQVPITLAIIVAFVPFVSRKTHCLEALALLIAANAVALCCNETAVIATKMMQVGYSESTGFKLDFWGFVELFTHALGASLAPFLIGLQLYVRKTQ